MSVRLRLALTILLTGVATALAVLVTVALAFQRFEKETTYARADAFLGRVVMEYDDLLDKHQRSPDEFRIFLRNLLLYEPGSQLYLLDMDGTVLSSTGAVMLPPGFKVTLAPGQQSAEAALSAEGRKRAPYVMGDDPEYMDVDAVVAARPLTRAQIRLTAPVAGYLYVVCRKPMLAGQNGQNRLALFRSSLAGPALASVLAVLLLGSLLAAWIIVAVTKPLQVLSDEVAAAARVGFGSAVALPSLQAAQPANDEFGRLRSGFVTLLATLRQQWDELQRLDQFRRESVSNLSHDLRSPLTATVACLDTLERRWASDAGCAQAAPADRSEDHRLLSMALRNTHNAARLVRSLGDLALLDEPQFKLHLLRLDVGEVLDDISLRFAARAAAQGVLLRVELQPPASGSLVAAVDVELFERAVANLLDNALKFTPSGGQIVLSAALHPALHSPGPDGLRVSVSDSGAGIAPADQAQLFDRYFQSRTSVAPASSEEGKGLGLAIVKRIAELHGGSVRVVSTAGQGTAVHIDLPMG